MGGTCRFLKKAAQKLLNLGLSRRKVCKIFVETTLPFLFSKLLGGWCELSRADAGQERREALFPKRVLSAPRSPFPPANSSAAFSFGEKGAKEKAKQKEKRRRGDFALCGARQGYAP